MRKMRVYVWLIVFTILAAPAYAQKAGARAASGVYSQSQVDLSAPTPAPASWGTSSETQIVVFANGFTPPDSTFAWTWVNTGGLSISQTTAAQDDWWGGVMVPNGAVITKIVLEACDTSATGQLLFGLARGTSPNGGGSNITVVGATGTAATPGCAFFTEVLAVPFKVSNNSQYLTPFVDWQGTFSTALRLHSFRVFYRLEVSPAPGTATFSDVPVGSPFHRFVEALVASGITGGCGAGQYCPNDPVTRGQMAVFIAAALGLHFPN